MQIHSFLTPAEITLILQRSLDVHATYGRMEVCTCAQYELCRVVKRCLRVQDNSYFERLLLAHKPPASELTDEDIYVIQKLRADTFKKCKKYSLTFRS